MANIRFLPAAEADAQAALAWYRARSASAAAGFEAALADAVQRVADHSRSIRGIYGFVQHGNLQRLEEEHVQEDEA